MLCETCRDLCQFTPAEPIVLAKFNRSLRTVQIENCLMPAPDYVDMRRTVIIRIDHHAQPAKPQGRRHNSILSQS
jgi:hypothetical protein